MLFSVLAFIALIASVCIKERKKSLIVQSLNCIFEAIYCFIITAYTGAILSIINALRTIPFLNKEKFNKIIYLIILLLFEGIIIVNCIFTWEGYISLLPTVGSMIRTYCLWESNMKLVRFSGVIIGLTYGSYYLYHNSYFMLLGNIILLIIGIYTIWKNDINYKKSF